MTLNTTYKPAVAQGNGIIKEFSYSFNPISSSYIKVYFEIEGKWVEQKTGWSATVSDNGGIVTFLEAPNTRVSIERDVPESQPTSYTTSSGFQASVIEHSFDLLTGMVQELKDASDRSVKVEVGDNQTPEELLQTVYDKLDSATEIAGDAISAANQAQTAADNATAAVNSAEQTLANVTAYVDSAKVDIDSTVAQAKADVNSAIDEATMDISNIVSDAEGSITNIAVTEANKAIANAAQEATDMATASLNSYVDGTVNPSLQTYVDQAQEDANSAATSMEQAALSATAASNYASNASADADNAAESAGLAANSAGSAATSEGNAKASETNAKGGVSIIIKSYISFDAEINCFIFSLVISSFALDVPFLQPTYVIFKMSSYINTSDISAFSFKKSIRLWPLSIFLSRYFATAGFLKSASTIKTL